MQRQEAAQRQQDGVEWQPRLFRKVQGGPGGPEEGEEDLSWILRADMLVTHQMNISAANSNSNGTTPEEITQEILAIAPIVQGQNHSQQAGNPPQKQENFQPSQQPIQPAPAQHTQMPVQKQQTVQQAPQSIERVPQPLQQASNAGNHDSLIDFGGDSAAPYMQPAQQVNNDTYIPPGLQEPLQPGHPIKRQDSNTKEVDEFVDAEDGR